MRLAIAAIVLLVIGPAYGAPKAHSYSFTLADLNHDGYVTEAEFTYYLAHRDDAAPPSNGGSASSMGGGGGGGAMGAGGKSGSIHVGLVVTGG